MPKIISCTKEDILAEAKKQAMENGYSGFSIKSIASSCKVAVGTIYNYFPSKDMLVASFILADWVSLLDKMKEELSGDANKGIDGIRRIYEELVAFNESYRFIFNDRAMILKPRYSMPDKHKLMKNQIAELICVASDVDGDTATFVADVLLMFSVDATEYENIEKFIKKLIYSYTS